jgi:Rad3-related DNA helicase
VDANEIVLEVMGGTTPLPELVEAAIRGPLAETGLAVREGQLAMAKRIAQTWEAGGTAALAAEAPCGTGKSIGYLLPGVFAVMRDRQRTGAFRRMVVSTAGIALQRQIVGKDVPMLGQALGITITAAVLKGRGNYLCLTGDTSVLTRDGPIPIRDLAGRKAILADGNGAWVECEVRSYGVQSIMRLRVSRKGRELTIGCTAEHRWFTQQSASGPIREITTSDLAADPRVGSGRPIHLAWGGPEQITRGRLRPSPFGVAHGIMYGDGTVYRNRFGEETGTVVLHGAKDRELMRFFSGCGTVESHQPGYSESQVQVYDLPGFFKRLPDLGESATYLYGWLAGYFAADGCVGERGDCTIASADVESLRFSERVCARLGIATTGISTHERAGLGEHPSKIYQLGLTRGTIGDDFFILSHHKARAVEISRKRHRAERRWRVDAVEEVEHPEEVFCAIVPTTRSFALTGNILTGNCLDRLAEESQLISRDTRQIQAVQGQHEAGWSGDRDDLRIHVDGPVWGRLSVGGEECLGERCPHFAACPAEAARSKAVSAAVVVVNHWYLALGSKRLADGSTSLLVVDEAHDLEDALRGAGGITVRESTARRWAKVLDPVAAAEAVAIRDGLLPGDDWKNPSTEVREAIADVLRAGDLRMKGYKTRLTGDWATDEARAAPERIRYAADRLRAHVSRLQEPVAQDRARAKARALGLLAEKVEKVLRPDSTQSCAWVEKNQERTEVTVAPVSPLLPNRWGPIVACSATLGGGADPARPVREVLARPKIESLQVPSPWPLAEMAVAIVPRGPAPSDPGWAPWMERVAADVVRMLGGGVLVLCTSLVRAREVAAFLRSEAAVQVRCQGEAGRTELLEWFAADGNAVLVGSRSLFQGVDVPGDALRGVIIDKVPFPSPADPMEEAIADRMRLLQQDPFRSRSVAYAQTVLRQGAGRLIRSATDRGVIVVTDPRLWSANWGPAVMRALEPYPVTSDLGAIARLRGGEPAEPELPIVPKARRVQR